MGLLELFGIGRKSWKDADPKKRLAGVQDVPRADQAVLLSLAHNDSDTLVRQAAARRLKKASHLEKILTSSDAEVVAIARERLAGVAVAEIKRRPLSEAAAYLAGVEEQSSLVEISLQASDTAVQQKAFEKLCAQEDPSAALLARVAIQHGDEAMALSACAAVSKRQSLKDISKKAKSEKVRERAAQKIKDIISEQGKPSAEKQRRLRKKELQTIFDRMQVLASSTRFDEVASEVESCAQQWGTCDAAYPDVSTDAETTALYESFDRACNRFTTRRQEAADQATLLESSGTQLETCLTTWQERRHALENTDQESLATFEAEAQAAWDAVEGHDLHPDIYKTFSRVWQPGAEPVESSADLDTQGSPSPRPVIELSAEDTLAVECVLTEAEALVTAEDWKEADYRFKEIHKIWSNLTIDLDFKDPLRTRFHDSYVAFKNAGFERREKRRTEQDERIALMQGMVAEAKLMAEEDVTQIDLHQRWEAIQDLQQRWKDVGSVPQGKVRPVRTQFREFCDIAYAPLREQREADAWKGFANVHLAEELIEKVEALLQTENFDNHDISAQILQGMKALQQEWRTIKRLPREKNDELWGRFKGTADQVFEKLAPYFAECDLERVKHYDRKQELLEELKTLTTEDKESQRGEADKEARQVCTERVKEIQKEWKDVGPVPREKDKEQWQEFRAALDDFFGRRRKEYEGLAEEQTENLHQKLAILAEAGDLAEDAELWKKGERSDLKESDLLRMVKELQQSWKNIGYIPKDKVDDMWKRFRGYCDRVFACLKDYFDAMDTERQENVAKKRDLLAKIQVFAESDDPCSHREQVQAIQAVWRTIGYIPRDAMEEVNGQYQAYCDIIFNVSRTVQPLESTEAKAEDHADEELPVETELVSEIAPEAVVENNSAEEAAVTAVDEPSAESIADPIAEDDKPSPEIADEKTQEV